MYMLRMQRKGKEEVPTYRYVSHMCAVVVHLYTRASAPTDCTDRRKLKEDITL